jgi:hypothetical protein
MTLLEEKVGRIERVESIVVSLPLVRPFETSFGVSSVGGNVLLPRIPITATRPFKPRVT